LKVDQDTLEEKKVKSKLTKGSLEEKPTRFPESFDRTSTFFKTRCRAGREKRTVGKEMTVGKNTVKKSPPGYTSKKPVLFTRRETAASRAKSTIEVRAALRWSTRRVNSGVAGTGGGGKKPVLSLKTGRGISVKSVPVILFTSRSTSGGFRTREGGPLKGTFIRGLVLGLSCSCGSGSLK